MIGWISQNERFDVLVIQREIKSFKFKPKISIIVPVYNVDSKWLDKCIKSVVDQFYENWELCIHDDASTRKDTIKCLKKWAKSDFRIKISFGFVNQHISGASNSALKLATGEFMSLMDNDDEISPNALYEFISLLNKNRSIDMIYSDEDKIDMKDNRYEPFFKPDWSPEALEGCMYTAHLACYRMRIVKIISGFRSEYNGAQDYDFVLRFTEHAKKIAHIPKILYHWRAIKVRLLLRWMPRIMSLTQRSRIERSCSTHFRWWGGTIGNVCRQF